MNYFPVFGLLLACAAGALVLAGLVIISCLVAAAMFPRGHPSADRLRAFAGSLPRFVALGFTLVSELGVVLLLAFLVVLAMVFS
ncbi:MULTISPECIES: hypothetical protein [Variovorax]|uniref:hypothetical protein n=1 Tax=Variovorax TaxID=34072 RepID=UPI00285A2369|nr:hypothetical protein [Variovorax sp. 3319]MDR6886171.1 putative outer membrane lipoprotein [Variovorax sp. 3319]